MCFPPLAQLDRVSDSDSEGHRFESCRAGHKNKPVYLPDMRVFFLYYRGLKKEKKGMSICSRHNPYETVTLSDEEPRARNRELERELRITRGE